LQVFYRVLHKFFEIIPVFFLTYEQRLCRIIVSPYNIGQDRKTLQISILSTGIKGEKGNAGFYQDP